MLFVTILWLGGFPYARMLCYQFECVLNHYVLEDIVFVWLGSVGMLLCLIVEGVRFLCILKKYDL